MDYFCRECSSKPGWEWNDAKVIMHSCQRCFQMKQCNDYGYRKPKTVTSAAPDPKSLVATNINQHAQVDLPRAKGVQPPMPQPVYEVEPPVPSAPQVVAPAPIVNAGPDERNDVDKALDAVQPNRPGVRLNTVDKAGRQVKPAKQVAVEAEAP